MNNLNSILIEGNIVRDPMIRQTPRGKSICDFPIATSRFFRDEDGLEKEVSFFGIETKGILAERCHQVGKKGRGVRVVGRLRQDRWTDAFNKPHTRVIIAAEHVEFKPEFKKQQPEEIPSLDIETEVQPVEEMAKEPVDAEVVEQV